MITFLKKLSIRIFRKNKANNLLKFADIDPTTILINSLKIRFDKEKQNRIYVKIGKQCLIKSSFIFETEKGNVKIGNNVHIGGATFISRNSITIGNDVTMAWDITLYDHNSHSVYWSDRQQDNARCYDDYINHNGNNIKNKDWSNVVDKPIIINDKVWIGFGVTILKGVTVGEGAVIGAKSVVTKDVPAWTVVAGNPAQVVKNVQES